MLSKTRLNKYCNGDISLIANYYDALNDKNEIREMENYVGKEMHNE